MEFWRCVVCDYIYDEVSGHPAAGIPSGTPWQELPLNWKCPDCGESKLSFESIPIEEYLSQMFVLGDE